MVSALDMPEARAACLAEEVPYFSAEQLGSSHHAVAAMLMSGSMIGESLIKDPEAMAMVTGVPHGSERFSTGTRTLRTVSEHGTGVAVIGQMHYQGIASFGSGALCVSEAAHFDQLDEPSQISERYSTGLLVGKLADRQAYERRAATLDDIRELHDANWLTKIEVNGRRLFGGPGFRRLPLVVLEAGMEKVLAHNPGNHEIVGEAVQAFRYEDLHEAWMEAGFVLHAIGRVRAVGSNSGIGRF